MWEWFPLYINNYQWSQGGRSEVVMICPDICRYNTNQHSFISEHPKVKIRFFVMPNKWPNFRRLARNQNLDCDFIPKIWLSIWHFRTVRIGWVMEYSGGTAFNPPVIKHGKGRYTIYKLLFHWNLNSSGCPIATFDYRRVVALTAVAMKKIYHHISSPCTRHENKSESPCFYGGLSDPLSASSHFPWRCSWCKEKHISCISIVCMGSSWFMNNLRMVFMVVENGAYM